MSDTDHYILKPKRKPLNFPQPDTNPAQYDKPIGPVRPSRLDRASELVDKVQSTYHEVRSNKHVSGAIDWLKERSRNVADNMRDDDDYERTPGRKRKPTYARDDVGNVYRVTKRKVKRRAAPRRSSASPINPDPFGVGNFKGFGR